MMKSSDVRRKFIEFYKARGHVEVPSAPLVPENDPTTLFTGSGMQPMLPYLLGQKHPLGTRLVDSQKCFRTQDIEEVGDNRHTTFFEMLGNWSLGDYFKAEQQDWIWEFLTKELSLDPKKLYFSVFEGNDVIPRDEEADHNWKNLGVPHNHIYYYGVNKNWWARSSYADMPVGEPGGPSSEIFYDFGIAHDKKYGEECHPNCDCGRFLEIGNNVFMTYKRTKTGFELLDKKNIDFGGGLERLIAATNDNPDVFQSDLFESTYRYIETLTHRSYGKEVETTRALRIISDHIRAAVMLLADSVLPSNKAQGYVLRRLIRRALLYGRNLGLVKEWTWVGQLVAPVAAVYAEAYPEVVTKSAEIKILLEEEALRFGKTLEKGIAEIEKVKQLDGKIAFQLYETYGFPWEMTEEIAVSRGYHTDRAIFESEFEKHKALSRSSAAGMFKGGLADQGEHTTKLHTAHHLLLATLQKLIDPIIKQRGSNITAERLRMDFNYSKKLTAEELIDIEKLVNEKILENLQVLRREMPREEAETLGAQMEFGHKYPDRVSVYFIGQEENFFSAEFCGGPHVDRTGVIGVFHITKEESAGSGVRRIYAVVG